MYMLYIPACWILKCLLLISGYPHLVRADAGSCKDLLFIRMIQCVWLWLEKWGVYVLQPEQHVHPHSLIGMYTVCHSINRKQYRMYNIPKCSIWSGVRLVTNPISVMSPITDTHVRVRHISNILHVYLYKQLVCGVVSMWISTYWLQTTFHKCREEIG